MSERPQVLVELGDELDRVAERALRAPRLPVVSTVLTGLAVASAVIVAGMVLLIGGHRAARTPAASGAARSGLARAFAAFRRPRIAADLLTASAFDSVADLGPGWVIEPEQSRLVLVKPGERVWLVPSRTALCLVLETRVGNHTSEDGACSPTSQAARNGVSFRFGNATMAVVPDGSREITAVGFDRRSMSVTPNADGVIQANVYARYLTLRDAQGKLHTQTVGTMVFEGWSTPPVGHPVGEIKLQAAGRTPRPTGTARIYKSGRLNLLWLDLFNLPQLTPPRVYAVWLTAPPTGATKLLAIIRSGQTRRDELTTYCGLPYRPSRFRELLITSTSAPQSRQPGPAALSARITIP